MNRAQRFAAIEKCVELKISRKQTTIVLHCLEYEFLYSSEIKEKGFTRDVVRRMVKMGILERHPKNHYDELHYDLSDRYHAALKRGLLKNAS